MLRKFSFHIHIRIFFSIPLGEKQFHMAYQKTEIIDLLKNFIERSQTWWFKAAILFLKAKAGLQIPSKSWILRKISSQILIIIL